MGCCLHFSFIDIVCFIKYVSFTLFFIFSEVTDQFEIPLVVNDHACFGRGGVRSGFCGVGVLGYIKYHPSAKLLSQDFF